MEIANKVIYIEELEAKSAKLEERLLSVQVQLKENTANFQDRESLAALTQ